MHGVLFTTSLTDMFTIVLLTRRDFTRFQNKLEDHREVQKISVMQVEYPKMLSTRSVSDTEFFGFWNICT